MLSQKKGDKDKLFKFIKKAMTIIPWGAIAFGCIIMWIIVSKIEDKEVRGFFIAFLVLGTVISLIMIALEITPKVLAKKFKQKDTNSKSQEEKED